MWCCSLTGWPCVQTQNLRNLAANHAKEMQQRRKDQLNADNERRNKKLAKIAIEHRVGAWVMIRVHSGDRSSLGKALLRMLVVEYHEVTGFYRLAHEHGVLERMVLSNQIFKNSNSQADTDGIMQSFKNGQLNKISIRSLAKKVCPWGGQGKMKCLCRKGCKGQQCSCRKANRECNSSCTCNVLGNCHNTSSIP